MIDDDDTRVRKERSPSYPFISLPKALERVEAVFNAHRREPARVSVVAETWGYSPQSSGLQQTIAALKQYGLLEDEGSGYERKVRVSELARRILADMRPGVREQAIRDSARRPKLIAEHLLKWVPERPSDSHCLSELQFDRGFTPPAAKMFLRVFDDTVAYAGFLEDDKTAEEAGSSDALKPEPEDGLDQKQNASWKHLVPPAVVRDAGGVPLSERLQVLTTGNQLTVSAALVSGHEVDKLIRILQANRALLDDEEEVKITPSA